MEHAEFLLALIERLDFEMFCSQQADNAYYRSGRYDRDAKKLAELQKELASLSET